MNAERSLAAILPKPLQFFVNSATSADQRGEVKHDVDAANGLAHEERVANVAAAHVERVTLRAVEIVQLPQSLREL